MKKNLHGTMFLCDHNILEPADLLLINGGGNDEDKKDPTTPDEIDLWVPDLVK